jgi:chemotaxis protein histidine kinase CheA
MEGAIQGLKGDFEVQAKEDVAKLVVAATALLRAPNDQEKRQTVYMLAHELRGQGGSFGYPLVTRFGDQLCRYLDAADILDAKALVVVKAAADAMAVVINNGVSGDGGDTGRQLVAMLDKVVAQVKGEA